MSRHRGLPLLLTLLTFFSLSIGDSGPNEFIYPGPSGPSNNFRANLNLTLGSSVVIQWVSNSTDSFELALFQQAIGPESGIPIQTIYST